MGGAGGEGGSPAVAATVFFSEYIEGDLDTKALEIYNAGPGDFDLTDCVVNQYDAGNATLGDPDETYDLPSDELGEEQVWVLCDTDVGSTECDVDTLDLTFDGDDALTLVCDGTILDMIGVVGEDPGTEWGDAGEGTQNQTLRRQCTVTTGDPNGSDTPSDEWEGFDQNDATGLGEHCP